VDPAQVEAFNTWVRDLRLVPSPDVPDLQGALASLTPAEALIFDQQTKRWVRKQCRGIDLATIRVAGVERRGPKLPGAYVGIRCVQGHSLPVDMARLGMHAHEWDLLGMFNEVWHDTRLSNVRGILERGILPQCKLNPGAACRTITYLHADIGDEEYCAEAPC
jgi:hypothetical protein